MADTAVPSGHAHTPSTHPKVTAEDRMGRRWGGCGEREEGEVEDESAQPEERESEEGMLGQLRASFAKGSAASDDDDIGRCGLHTCGV